jgi:hypothetical protein
MDEEVKVSGLPNDTSIDGNHYFPLNDPTGPTTKRTTIQTLLDFINDNLSPAEIATALAGLGTSQNMIINGGCDIWQRNTSATPNDDVYTGCDRWNFLTEANAAWTVARDTDVPTTGGSKYSMKFSNVTLNNQCGIVQILEGRDAYQLFGKSVSLSFYAKTNGTEISKLRCAILSWTGTEDAVTSDVVSAWAQGGTNPTWATNWTMENTPADINLTSSWQRFTVENVPIDTASTKNVAVVIWVDDGTITAGDDFYITQVMLNVGANAAQYLPRPVATEQMLCERFYEVVSRGIFGQVGSASTAKLLAKFATTKRGTPTVGVLNTTANHEETWVASRTPAPLAITSAVANTNGATINVQGFSGMTLANRFHTEADNIYSVDAEL